MASPLVFERLPGLGQAIGGLGSTLGAVLGQRQQQAAQQQQMNALQRVLSSADFSTPEGQQQALGQMLAQNVPMKDALALIQQYSPDPVEQFLAGIGAPTAPQAPAPSGIPQQGPGQAQIGLPIPGRGNAVDLEEQATNPLALISDEALVRAASSGDRRLEALAKSENERRGRADQRYQSDRKYHAEGAKKWLNRIDDERTSLRNKEMSLGLMENAYTEGDLQFFSPDNFANFMGRFGEQFRTPEGSLAISATKEFLLSNIQRAGARPNQWIEQQIAKMLAIPGRSTEANLAVIQALKHEVDLQKLYHQETDRISDYYRQKLGYVPENIGRLVEQSVDPLAQQAQQDLAYRLRNIHESYGYDRRGGEAARLKHFEILDKKKVPKGTPLTYDMMTFMVDKYGMEKAKDRAKKLGYTILSEDAYTRLIDG